MTDLLRESLFNILANRIDFDGIYCLDLFSGSGSFSWECLSRGAARAFAVELNRHNAEFIKRTAEALGVKGSISVFPKKVEAFLGANEQGFQLVSLDPPYKLQPKLALIEAVFRGPTLAKGGWLVMHHPTGEDYSEHPAFAELRTYGGASISFFQRMA
jgi:16S rRNA (guanine(966)-N(2))-methyltransferase RsmD